MTPFKYRAKRLDGGEWAYGYYVKTENGPPEIFTGKYHANNKQPYYMYEIDPATLGVCWGMKDKNRKEVYSNHVLRNPENGNTYYIEFNTSFGKFELIRNQTDSKLPTCTISALEIIEEE